MYDYFINVQEYLLNSAQKYPDKTALICSGTHLSYSALDSYSGRLAAAFMNLGLSVGDRVIICAGNSVAAVLSFWAVLKAGAICCVISDELSLKKINEIVIDAEPKFFIGDLLLDRCDIIMIKTGHLDQLMINHTASHRSVLDIDLATIIYTSGSTGKPKGVMMTHRNILAASTAINQYLRHTDTDIILSVLPLSFDYGLYQLIMSVSVGATLILEKNFLLPLSVLRQMIRQKATVFPIVPTMISVLDDYAKKFNFIGHPLRCVTNTGAALNSGLLHKLKALFPETEIFSMYGLTECKRCSYLPPADLERKPGSVGLAIPNTELWIEDEQGNRLGPHQVGQLVIRGATIMRGYWRKAEASLKRLKPGLLPSEQVLHTGDYCFLDEEGYLYFYGRMDQMLKCKGVKVSPKEIEEALCQIPGVKEAVVLGKPDELLGDAIVAFISTYAQMNESQLHIAIRSMLKPIERPKEIFVLSQLPKTINGKYDRVALEKFL